MRVHIFTARRYVSAVLGVVILSVRPSIYHTRALWQNQTMHCGYFDTRRKGNHSSFWYQQWLVGDAPFHLTFALKVTPSSKNADFDTVSLVTSQPKEIVKKVKSWRIESRQRAIDGVRMLPLSSQRVAQKTIFVFNEISFQPNKVCYKVSLCENFQRQSCSITISPSNGP